MNKRILIVDDDEAIRIGFQEILEKAGFEVFIADKAPHACELAEKHKPDVVIVDYFLLDDLSGVDVCKFIKDKKELKDTKLIMITGVLNKNQAQKMLHFGFDKILIKPIESEHLLDEVRLLLGSHL